jgi:DNA processing protein
MENAPSLTWIALALLPANPRTLALNLERAGGDPAGALDRLADRPDDLLRQAAGVRTRLAAAGMAVVTRADPGYPALLGELPDPPPALFMKGELTGADDPAVAIVGSRRASPYGLAVARTLGRDLAAAGVTVISGLARGIDAAAHGGALAAPRGRAVALLGSGPDVIYPPEHRSLAAAIAARGALVSEFPPGSPPLARHFPRRNRLISGLSRSVVVVEAAADSGSLITARLALDQGREVHAVPGPIDAPGSAGTHALLREGARLAASADDVLEEFPAEVGRRLARSRRAAAAGPPPGLPPAQLEIWQALDPVRPRDVDDLAEATKMGVSELVSSLLGLEIRGLARALPGPRYLRGGGQEAPVSYIDPAPGPAGGPQDAAGPAAGESSRES